MPLGTAVRLWATPNARDGVKGRPSDRWTGQRSLPRDVSGLLNPAFVVALMGAPEGWLETEREVAEDEMRAAATTPRWPAPPGQDQYDWEPPRVVPPRTVTERVAKLRALGNAVVPAQAYPIFKAIVGADCTAGAEP